MFSTIQCRPKRKQVEHHIRNFRHKRKNSQVQISYHKEQVIIPVANISASHMQVYASLQELL